MADTQRGNCDNCACSVFQVQTDSKRCRGCGHGAVFHQAVVVNKAKAGGKTNWKAKIEDAKKMKDNSGVVFYAARNFAAWAAFALYNFWTVKTGYQQPVYNRGVATEFYSYTAVAFLLAVVYSFVALVNSQNSEKRQMGQVLCLVNFIAMANYISQAMELSPSYFDGYGHPTDPSRFLEWITTCPVLIYLIAEITDTHDLADETATGDYILIFFGAMSTFFKQPYSMILACCSVTFFYSTITNIGTMFERAIRQETMCSLDPAALKKSQILTVASWSFFPIAFFLQRGNIVSYQVGEILFCLSDICSKVFLTLILVNATLEESMNSKAKKMEGIAVEIEAQMVQADKLLEKLMPPSVVEAMKAGKSVGAEEFASVTVFFSDITNFVALSNNHSTKEMLGTLNKLWVEYDVICKRWGMYKVETIGDAFLGVIGAPERIPDHAERATNFAIDVIQMVANFRTDSGEEIVTRVGLNTGPITAGVLGDSNPHWCIVGDAVNTASRMESTSKPMRIHISENTYKAISKKAFLIEGPDPMNIKGKGMMNTFWPIENVWQGKQREGKVRPVEATPKVPKHIRVQVRQVLDQKCRDHSAAGAGAVQAVSGYHPVEETDGAVQTFDCCEEMVKIAVDDMSNALLLIPAAIHSVACSQKTVREAYHVICNPCALQKNVCAKCQLPEEIMPSTAGKTAAELLLDRQNEERLLSLMTERQRRSYARKVEREDFEGAAKIADRIRSTSNGDDDDFDFGFSDDESEGDAIEGDEDSEDEDE
ncbi:hypothetical protein HDU81_007169 [Chytriomyces hyalinus]|nr:hypothetical protein HDU81_007169 [Chytriomyces hyalinus]